LTETNVRDLESKYIVQTYRRTPIVLVRGKGVRVFDQDGREYLDLLAGIGVGALGHGHQGLADAIADQAREMIHCSNLFFHPLQGKVAERLATLSGLSRAFFCNSGAEAVEACLKFARRYWYTKGDTARTEILAMEGDFHGRTYGALSVTWDDHYRAPFAPLLPNIRFIPVNDPAKLRAAVSEKTAAIILEPIQGEGGVRPLTHEFALAVNEVCARTGALLIADEVQCGLGRTGSRSISRSSECGRIWCLWEKRWQPACPWAPHWSRKRWRRRCHSAITAAPSAGTSWPAVPRSSAWTR
jgi:acetylornithine aminotransferase/acetylornithine/N-succinyldiaminopimelate aminotransferase